MPWTPRSQTAYTVASGAGTETKSFTAFENDFVIVYIACDTTLDAAPIASAGWTLQFDGTSSNNPGRAILTKFMGSTPDTGVEIKQAGAVCSVIVEVWPDVDLTTPLDGVTVTAQTGATPQTKTSATDNAMSIVTHWLDDDDMAGTGASPTGYSTIFQADTGQASTNAGCTISTAYLQLGVAGDQTPGAFTGLSTDQEWSTHMILKPAAGGGGLTIEAATGQIRATGNNAAVLARRLLEAETGAVAATGVDASLSVSRMMALNTGSAAATGSALDLIRSLVLAAETGGVAVTGSALSLAQASILALNTGALAATGSSAALLRSLILAAETGAGAVTGSDASLIAGLVLSLATGQARATGSDASLITSAVLALVSGAAAAAGQDAAFLRSLLIQAETGSAAVTGSDLDLLARRLIAAATGGAAITGSDADLLRSLMLDMQTGQAAVTGYPLSLLGALIYFYSFPQDSLRGGTLIAPERSGTVSRHEV